MAVTTSVNLTGAWQALATTGEVVFTASGPVLWAVTGSTSAPAFSNGAHVAQAFEDKSLTLAGAERLWVKSSGASGTVYVTADAPV